MKPDKQNLIRKLLKKKYGYMPRLNEYNGHLYVSDPVRPSEPWETYDNENEMIKALSNYY